MKSNTVIWSQKYSYGHAFDRWQNANWQWKNDAPDINDSSSSNQGLKLWRSEKSVRKMKRFIRIIVWNDRINVRCIAKIIHLFLIVFTSEKMQILEKKGWEKLTKLCSYATGKWKSMRIMTRTTTAPAHELVQTNWLSWSKSSAQFKRTVRTVQFSSWELFRQFFWTELNCSNSSVQFMRTIQTVPLNCLNSSHELNWIVWTVQLSSEELFEQFSWTELNYSNSSAQFMKSCPNSSSELN